MSSLSGDIYAASASVVSGVGAFDSADPKRMIRDTSDGVDRSWPSAKTLRQLSRRALTQAHAASMPNGDNAKSAEERVRRIAWAYGRYLAIARGEVTHEGDAPA